MIYERLYSYLTAFCLPLLLDIIFNFIGESRALDPANMVFACELLFYSRSLVG